MRDLTKYISGKPGTKRGLFISLFLIIITLFSTGCMTVSRLGPGAASPGMLYSSTTYPNLLQETDFNRPTFTRDDIEIVERIEKSSRSVCATTRLSTQYLVGLLSFLTGSGSRIASVGDSGYGKIFKELARDRNVDGFLNKTVDTQVLTVDLLLVRIDRVTTSFSGVGYRFRKEPF
jgi:hypothetical protein